MVLQGRCRLFSRFPTRVRDAAKRFRQAGPRCGRDPPSRAEKKPNTLLQLPNGSQRPCLLPCGVAPRRNHHQVQSLFCVLQVGQAVPRCVERFVGKQGAKDPKRDRQGEATQESLPDAQKSCHCLRCVIRTWDRRRQSNSRGSLQRLTRFPGVGQVP